MTLRFWGVRGSIPTPGPHTVRYGGNTSCVSLELDAGHTLVLDAGTGIRRLGAGAPAGPHTYFVLLSHLHWDHIQGLPLFGPRNNPEARIVVLSGLEPEWGALALAQMDGLHFPVRPESLPAEIRVDTQAPGRALEPFGVTLDSIRLNHPGICYGYRLKTPGGSLVYMSDNEIGAAGPHATAGTEFARFCDGADILVHDAQYTEAELETRRGWGHSTVAEACGLAEEASVGRLVLFHHDPDRSDARIDDLVDRARFLLAGSAVNADAASEGLSFEI
jgi:phosphoribosyl 1,2-cyclic phosphodiesterase